MKLINVRCNVCAKFYVYRHGHCPFCGSVHINGRDFNVANGRRTGRATPLPHIIKDLTESAGHASIDNQE